MKKARLDTRITEEKKKLYARAAALGNFAAVTEFVTSAADKEAAHIIQRHQELAMSENDQKVFIEALLNPPAPNKALKKAAQDYRKVVS